MSASENVAPSGGSSIPEPVVVELKAQLGEIRSQLTAAETKLGAVLETVEKKLTTAESKLGEKESELTKTKEYLRSLKAHKLDSRWLAGVVAVLGAIIGAGFVCLSLFILKNSLSWEQTCGVLGLCLLWVAFATISIRLLADRAK
jgi:hypothetical protein